MLFSNYLNQLMDDLEISNTELAEAIHISQSYVSRIRNGSRTPPPGGNLHKKIYYGLQNIVEKKDNENITLSNLLPERYEDFLEASIYTLQVSDLFHKHLNWIMNQLEISNRELAQEVYCDESLISKYRTGERLPKDPSAYESLVHFLAKKTLVSDQWDNLSNILDCPSKSITDVEKTITKLLFKKKRDSGPIIDMLSSLEQRPTFSLDFAQLSTVIKNINLPAQKINIKKGKQGLRKQVFIGLSTCAKITDPLEIKIYSNQNIQWLIEDQKYFETWRFLMMAVLQKGHRITIIHHLDRSQKELSAIIEGWIPLHLSGNLQLYDYNHKSDLPFQHSMFIAQGLLCITGSAIEDLDQEASYYLIQDDEKRAIVERSFDQILNQSEKLLYTKLAHNYNEAMQLFEGVSPQANKVPFYCIQTGLPLWSMDPNLMNKILERNQVSEKRKIQIINWVNHIKQFYQHHLQNNDIYECFYMPSIIPLNRIPFDIPMFSDQDEPIYYHHEDFIAHFESIIEKNKHDTRYNVAILEKPRFDDVRLVQYGEDYTLAIKFSSPIHIINYRQQAIHESIKNYIQELVHQNLKTTDQLESMLEVLKK